MVELVEANKLGKSSPNKILFLLELGKRRMIEPTLLCIAQDKATKPKQIILEKHNANGVR